MREPVDEQGSTDGASLDGCNFQVFVVGVRTAPLSVETVDAYCVWRNELHVARAAQRRIKTVDATQTCVQAGFRVELRQVATCLE